MVGFGSWWGEGFFNFLILSDRGGVKVADWNGWWSELTDFADIINRQPLTSTREHKVKKGILDNMFMVMIFKEFEMLMIISARFLEWKSKLTCSADFVKCLHS